METEFALSRIFLAHAQDVKCVVPTSSGLISCSRDGTVKLWAERAGNYDNVIEIRQRNSLSVNSVAIYQTDDDWLLFAGLKDGSIEVFNAASAQPLVVLQEHSSNVCVLFVDSVHKLLLSGSWDMRAIVWSIEDIIQRSDTIQRSQLGEKHKQSVWAIATIPTKPIHYLTGCADRTIKLFNSERKLIRTFEGHEDVVRSIVILSETVFCSAANDSTLRLWSAETGNCLQTCESTFGEMIFGICKLELRSGQQFIVAGGEKGYCEIYSIVALSQLVFVQKIRLPVGTIWSVANCRNSDIALATSSGSIYIYTLEEGRKASEELLCSFDAEFASLLATEMDAQKTAQNDIVTIKVALDDGAPNLELRYEKGTDPAIAAENFIRENNLPVSYLNEITEYIKNAVPEARLADAAKYRRQETQKEVIDGEKFDMSLEVKLSENGQAMHLGYNYGEDPDFAVQRFIEKHSLPIKMMGQLSAFLRSQIPELQPAANQFVRIGGGGSSASSTSFADPFTGSRYVPGGIPGGNNDSSNFGATGDPLTGGNRYVPGAQAPILPNASLPQDKKRPRGGLIKEFFKFGLEGVSGKTIPKLKEMNEMQPHELKLNDEQLNAVDQIMSDVNYEVSAAHVTGLATGLLWSIETIVPFLDVFRVALLNRDLNALFCSPEDVEGNSSKCLETRQRLVNLLISDPPDPVRILVCRALANAACHLPGRSMLMSDIATISKVVANQLFASKPTIQIAAASAFANFSRLLLLQGDVAELGPREDVLRAIISAVESHDSFSEFSPIALTRILQAFVTVMWGDSTVIGLAKNREITKSINKIKDSVSEENAKEVARDIIEMIHAV